MARQAFNWTVSFAGWATNVLKPELAYVFDEDQVSNQIQRSEEQVSRMGYTTTTVLNPEQQFTVLAGSKPLAEINEGQSLPLVDSWKGADKGYEMKEYGWKIKVTKLMADWLQTNQTLAGSDSSVQVMYQRFNEDIQKLRRGAMKARVTEATKVFANGWVSTSANWAGSATPYGQALFSTSHVYYDASGASSTFDNTLDTEGTADAALSATSLQDALDTQKKELRLHEGWDRIETPSRYVLFTPRALDVTARGILNTDGNQANVYSGTGNNSEEVNPFYFNGNRVEYFESSFLWETDKDGATIGSDAYRFLINREGLQEAQALRHLTLNGGEAEMRYDEDTKSHFVSFYETCAFDHYGAECYIVWSRGTA